MDGKLQICEHSMNVPRIPHHGPRINLSSDCFPARQRRRGLIREETGKLLAETLLPGFHRPVMFLVYAARARGHREGMGAA
jgi:hypothetical protein